MDAASPPTASCNACGAARSPNARFCGSCGAAWAEPPEDPSNVARYEEIVGRLASDGQLDTAELAQLDEVRRRLGISDATHTRLVEGRRDMAGPPAATLTLAAFVDVSTIDYFEVGSRCMLRLQVRNDGPLAIEALAIHGDIPGEAELPVARSGRIFPAQTQTIPIWLIPRVAGFQELRGVVDATDLMGEHVFGRFEGVLFRVGGAGDGPRVSVINVDQRSARVVDNSKSNFGAAPAAGGIVGEGTWHPLPLRAITPAEAALAAPALRGTIEVAAAKPKAAAAAPRTASATSSVGASVSFTVRADDADFDVTTTLAQGEIATVYGGRRRGDGAPVAVKVADDAADNDLMAAELRALRLLTAEESPQRKHLPRVLGQFRTADARAGTVLEHIDGYDLTTLREKLPDGIPARHMIWLMRRCFSVLGWAHAHGVLHGNVDPAHILVRPHDHNVWLVDWCWSIVNPAQTGEKFRCLNEEYSAPEVAEKKPPLPSADLYSLGRCMIYAAGGDAKTGSLPEGMDERLARFIKFLVVDSPLGRAQDAWALYARLDRLREELYGAHEFIPLVV